MLLPEDLLLKVLEFFRVSIAEKCFFERAFEERERVNFFVERCRESHVMLQLSVFGFDVFGACEGPTMRVDARVGELGEDSVEGSEGGVVAVFAESGDRVGDESKRVGELGHGKAEEERLVIRNELPHALERDGVVSEANDAGVGEGLPEVEELRHHVRDLERQNGHAFRLRRREQGFPLRQRRFHSDEPGLEGHGRKHWFWLDGVGGDGGW